MMIMREFSLLSSLMYLIVILIIIIPLCSLDTERIYYTNFPLSLHPSSSSSFLLYVSALSTVSPKPVSVSSWVTTMSPTIQEPATIPSGTLLISTIDGKLHALDMQTGKERWAFGTGSSLLKSSSTSQTNHYDTQKMKHHTNQQFELDVDGDDDNDSNNNKNNNKEYNSGVPLVIPGVDGSLFYPTSRGWDRLPVTVADMVTHSPFQSDDSMYIGSKSSSLFLVDRKTGRIHKIFTGSTMEEIKAANKQMNYDDTSSNTSDIDGIDITTTSECRAADNIKSVEEDLLWIGKTDYSLFAYDQSHHAQWNVSMGNYFSFFDRSEKKRLSASQLESIGIPHFAVSVNGEIFAIAVYQQKVIWRTNMKSPVTAIQFVRDKTIKTNKKQSESPDHTDSKDRIDDTSSPPLPTPHPIESLLSSTDIIRLPHYYLDPKRTRDSTYGDYLDTRITSVNQLVFHIAQTEDGTLFALPNPTLTISSNQQQESDIDLDIDSDALAIALIALHSEDEDLNKQKKYQIFNQFQLQTNLITDGNENTDSSPSTSSSSTSSALVTNNDHLLSDDVITLFGCSRSSIDWPSCLTGSYSIPLRSLDSTSPYSLPRLPIPIVENISRSAFSFFPTPQLMNSDDYSSSSGSSSSSPSGLHFGDREWWVLFTTNSLMGIGIFGLFLLILYIIQYWERKKRKEKRDEKKELLRKLKEKYNYQDKQERSLDYNQSNSTSTNQSNILINKKSKHQNKSHLSRSSISDSGEDLVASHDDSDMTSDDFSDDFFDEEEESQKSPTHEREVQSPKNGKQQRRNKNTESDNSNIKKQVQKTKQDQHEEGKNEFPISKNDGSKILNRVINRGRSRKQRSVTNSISSSSHPNSTSVIRTLTISPSTSSHSSDQEDSSHSTPFNENSTSSSSSNNNNSSSSSTSTTVTLVPISSPPSSSFVSVLTHLSSVKTVNKIQLFTDRVLGTGSMGTVVYAGLFEGRECAIKRLMKPFFGHSNADKEISLLIQSDQHPNVLRYYAKEEDETFIYIALELCQGSLQEFVEVRKELNKIQDQINLTGLAYLHSLNIVHRDLKPANILLGKHYRCKLADMGLGKQLGMSRSSFDSHVSGSFGWQPQEVLLAQQNGHQAIKTNDKQPDNNDIISNSYNHSNHSLISTSVASNPTSHRLTKSVDVFSAGCVVYYVLTDGCHPFGKTVEREINIVNNKFDMSDLECKLIGQGNLSEAKDLISGMLSYNPQNRLSCDDAVSHPFFWSDETKLSFLQDASDRIEAEPEYSDVRLTIEKSASLVLDTKSGGWNIHLDQGLLDNLGKFRKYDFTSVRDLLRVIRNKRHHYRDLPIQVQQELGALPSGFLAYFTSRFPLLFMYVYRVMSCFCCEDQRREKQLYAYAPIDQQQSEQILIDTSNSKDLEKDKVSISNPLFPSYSTPLLSYLNLTLNPQFRRYYEHISVKRLIALQHLTRLRYQSWFNKEEDWEVDRRNIRFSRGVCNIPAFMDDCIDEGEKNSNANVAKNDGVTMFPTPNQLATITPPSPTHTQTNLISPLTSTSIASANFSALPPRVPSPARHQRNQSPAPPSHSVANLIPISNSSSPYSYSPATSSYNRSSFSPPSQLPPGFHYANMLTQQSSINNNSNNNNSTVSSTYTSTLYSPSWKIQQPLSSSVSLSTHVPQQGQLSLTPNATSSFHSPSNTNLNYPPLFRPSNKSSQP